MTVAGWIILSLSVGSVSAAFAWCVLRVLSRPGLEQHLHSQADISPVDKVED